MLVAFENFTLSIFSLHHMWAEFVCRKFYAHEIVLLLRNRHILPQSDWLAENNLIFQPPFPENAGAVVMAKLAEENWLILPNCRKAVLVVRFVQINKFICSISLIV